MLVKEFVERRLDGFPNSFYESLPDTCLEENCGYPTEMLETLTQLRCSNPRCPAKIAQRLQAIFGYLGIKGVGEVGIKNFVNERGLRNPMFVFAYEPGDVAEGKDGNFCSSVNENLSQSLYEQIQAKRSFTLAEYVRISHIPHVQTSAGALFDKYDDIEKAYDAIEAGGLDYIKDCLGIKNADVSLRAIKIYESLMTFKQDLIEAIDCVDIIKKNLDGMLSFKVCVSGDVGCGFKTKASFYDYVNSMNPERLHVDFLSAATKEIKYLIWNGGGITRKVQSVKSRNEKGENIPIMNATEFIEEMRNMLGE